MRVELLNIDTFGQTYNTSNQNQTYSLSSSSISTAPNAYNITVPLSFTRSNVKKISLKNIEMPIGFPTIRATSNLHIFTVASDAAYSTSYTIVLSDKNYTQIATLIADINTAFTSTYPTAALTLALNANGNIQISTTNSALFTSNIYVKPSNLAYLLGYRSAYDVLTTRQTVAAASFRLSLDDYVNIYFPQFSSRAQNTNGTVCSFKIPLNTVNGVVYYRADTNPPFINVAQNFHFNSITILISDKWGYSLNSYGHDLSLSIELEYA
jgi:hypothetical protein